MPHHFTFILNHPVGAEWSLINGRQYAGYPPPAKMTPRCPTPAMLGQPSGDMMTGGADNYTAFRIDILKMYNPQTTILKQACSHLKF